MHVIPSSPASAKASWFWGEASYAPDNVVPITSYRALQRSPVTGQTPFIAIPSFGSLWKVSERFCIPGGKEMGRVGVLYKRGLSYLSSETLS